MHQPADRQSFYAGKAPDSVVHMHDKIAPLQRLEGGQRSRRLELAVAVSAFLAAEDFVVVEKRNFSFGKDETLVQRPQAKGDQVQLVGENFLQAAVLALGIAAHVNGEVSTEAVNLRVQPHQFALQDRRICCPKAHRLCACSHGSGLQPGLVFQLCFQPGGFTHELCRRRQFVARRPALVFGGGTRKGLFQFEGEVFGFVAEDQRVFEVGEQTTTAAVEQVHITFDALQGGPQL